MRQRQELRSSRRSFCSSAAAGARPTPERERIVADRRREPRRRRARGARAARRRRARARSRSSSSTRSTGSRTRRSSSGSRSGSRFVFLAAALIVVGKRLVVDRGARRARTRRTSTRASRRRSCSSSRRAATALHAPQAARARPARRRRRARPRARSRPLASLGPAFDIARFFATPWHRGRRLVDEDGRPLRARRRSRRTRSTPPSRRAPTASSSAAPLVVVRLAAGRARTCPPDVAGWAPTGSSPTRRSARTPAARSRSTACRRSRPIEPKPALVCPCHYSTFDPGDRRHGALRPGRPRAAAVAARRSTASGYLRAAGNFSGPVGPSWWGVRTRKADAVIRERRPLRSTSAPATAPLLRKALRYVFPDHWSFLLGEVALYAFLVLVATGIYLTFFFDPTHARRRLPRRLRRRSHGQQMSAGLPLGRRHLALGQGRTADPADAPLGRERLHRGDRPAPASASSSRARSASRASSPTDSALTMLDARAARGLPRLLARRRPALRDGPRDRLLGRALDPVRRREPRERCSGAAPFPGAPSLLVAACTSRTCSSSRS